MSALRRCYLLGKNRILALPSSKVIELDEFFKVHPFLTQIPGNRLFDPINSNRPYLLSNAIRQFCRSGSIALYMANRNLVHIENLFEKSNVGVHEDTGLIVFKQLGERNLISQPTQDGYKAYSLFLKEIIRTYHGETYLNYLPEDFNVYLSDLEQKSDEKLLLHHPTLMSDLIWGEVCVDVFRVVAKELPNYMSVSTIQSILTAVGVDDFTCMTAVLNNGLLPLFLPFKLKNLYPVLSWTPGPHMVPFMPDIERGEVVVHVCRHDFIHGFEKPSIAVVQKNFPNFPHMKQLPDFSRDEVVRLCRNSFPKYPRSALLAFKNEGLWQELNLESRNAVPSIYYAGMRFYDGKKWT